MKFPPVALTASERARAYELWQELKCAEGEAAQEIARQRLQEAPMPVQQAIMREALTQIFQCSPYSKGRRNPFGTPNS